MNPARPEATHVAVRDGRILGAGSLDELRGWGVHELDARFADMVLMPGLIEGHSHLMAGTMWRNVYCGVFDATDPDGHHVAGSPTLDAVLTTLSGRAAATAAGGDATKGVLTDLAHRPQLLPVVGRAGLSRRAKRQPRTWVCWSGSGSADSSRRGFPWVAQSGGSQSGSTARRNVCSIRYVRPQTNCPSPTR